MKLTNETHEQEVQQATQEVEMRKKKIVDASYRLNYHFMAPSGWINDPNGLIQHKGVYHLFYQHNPYGVNWGPMHWGHAVSKDLIHWEHQPVALAPSEEYDFEEGNDDIGCFSGSAVSKGDELYLIYTGHVGGKSPKEVQAAASSIDGIHFYKHNQNPVIDKPPEDLSQDFRDPKVWRYDGEWYMVVGSSVNGKGAIPLYKSEDLIDWTYEGEALEADENQGDMWECPDLFPIKDKHALIVSPMNMADGKNIIMVGEMNYNNGKFTPESVKEIDDGNDFYAAQTFEDEQGRRILIAWMDTWQTDFPTKTEGWAGAMTIPRQVVLDGNSQVKLLPAPELQSLRENNQYNENIHLSPNEVVDVTRNDLDHSYEMLIDFDLKKAEPYGKLGIELRVSDNRKEKVLVYYDLKTKELVVDTTLAGGDTHSSLNKTKINVKDQLSIRLFMDTCSLEVLTADGEAWITNRIYSDLKNKGTRLFTEGTGVIVEKMETWSLKKVIE
ncbi:glycoside hydrolase family 32 protein [Halobacillus sp. B23F22_1]|uniref:glycoside hydrolase family 32 protein n=1 Tax=Halobacillus sp. B23F22_1 TaxID=3459514 RepID=UPI00373F24AF